MRRWAATALLVALAATTIAATIKANTDDPARLRVIGHGQIRFRGHGPEWWALEAHRLGRARRGEEARSDHLQRLLAARLERLVWLVHAFLCIHSHEAQTWDTNTGNGYAGGLQMDTNFMLAYGRELYRRKGSADNWTPAEQLAVAITAHAERGFEPWPNTAHACGLR